MRVWRASQQTLGVSRFRERNRMQPREDSRNRANGAAKKLEASAEVHRLPGLTQPIPQSAGRRGDSVVSANEKDRSSRGPPKKMKHSESSAHVIHNTNSCYPD